jgi:hypothetical protein
VLGKLDIYMQKPEIRLLSPHPAQNSIHWIKDLFLRDCGLHLEPLHQPYFCEGIFKIGSCGTICLGCLRTEILLISAS